MVSGVLRGLLPTLLMNSLQIPGIAGGEDTLFCFYQALQSGQCFACISSSTTLTNQSEELTDEIHEELADTIKQQENIKEKITELEQKINNTEWFEPMFMPHIVNILKRVEKIEQFIRDKLVSLEKKFIPNDSSSM